ncbi:hypothetical protein BELL_0054g00030 [Botrytis elliptica]|uniref:Uncharacterized protein n=1 Tax=Botrytis elliptica TaxID=278938 RepID=A0A4Z1KC72_9HELO|nr:hypothetical protein BELL_0054g00030 [Botrytis elliptica]
MDSGITKRAMSSCGLTVNCMPYNDMKSKDLIRSSIVEVQEKVTRDPILNRFDKLYLDGINMSNRIKEFGSYKVVVKIVGSLENGSALGL